MSRADVHGKNHHRDGSFGGFVERLRLRVADGGEVVCGPDVERELFLATVGGMGLTGLIVEVTFRLQPVETPWMVVETEALRDLGAMLEGLEASAQDWPYTVGWIDCLARGHDLGRGVLIRGRHARRGRGGSRARRRSGASSASRSMRRSGSSTRRSCGSSTACTTGPTAPGRRARRQSYERFFYPLDAIRDWNRLYGPARLPAVPVRAARAAAGRAAVGVVLERLAAAGAASFLSVIKDCGPASDAYLSFPVEGTTLALDLPYRGAATEALVHELDARVIASGGRIYLAKDAVTRAEDFARMMPRLGEWKAVRDRWDPTRRFRSALSVRLLGDPA